MSLKSRTNPLAPRLLCTALGAACCALALGCSGDAGLPNLGGPGLHPQDGRNGQTGSPQQGSSECDADSACRATAEARVAELTQPSTLLRSFVGARCEQVGLIGAEDSRSGPTCVCDLGDGGSLHVGPAGGDCQVRGRAGDCLWQSFAGCDRYEAHSCDAVCSDLEQRLAADAARTFDAQLAYFDCARQSCRSVLSIDGACTPAAGVASGERYDCALGGPAILEQYAQAHQPEPEPSQSGEAWPRSTPYVAGARGFIEVGVHSEVWDGVAAPALAYAAAQFCDTEGDSRLTGEILDALEGEDDCGVIRKTMWQSSTQRFFHVAEARLVRAGQSFVFEPTVANNEYFSSYQAPESFSAAAPAYGEEYRFEARGGGLSAALSLPVRLPEALETSSLDAVTRIEREALRLRWSGRGAAPLRLVLSLTPRLADELYFTELECLMKDDGEFVIPAELLAKLPDGIATASFVREARSVESSNGQRLLSLGRVERVHHLALGARCERKDVLDACKQFALHQQAAYEACGVTPVPSLESTCPAYLAESCVGCAAYFACRTKAFRCEAGTLTSDVGCSCPAP